MDSPVLCERSSFFDIFGRIMYSIHTIGEVDGSNDTSFLSCMAANGPV